MKIIKIEALENGGHLNQTSDCAFTEIPDGWAVIPEDMECENFPFGEVKAELLPFGEADPETGKIGEVMTVTEWIPGEMPEVEPTVKEPSTAELLDALLGVTE